MYIIQQYCCKYYLLNVITVDVAYKCKIESTKIAPPPRPNMSLDKGANAIISVCKQIISVSFFVNKRANDKLPFFCTIGKR